MNMSQKAILAAGLLLIAISCLLPPWVLTFQEQGFNESIRPAGYHLIWLPPLEDGTGYLYGVRVDYVRLISQIMAIIAVTLVALILIKGKKPTLPVMLIMAFLMMIPASRIIRVYAEDDGEYLGRYSANPINSDSTSNPVGEYGSTVSPTSINNSVGPYGSSVSSTSARNPFATDTPKLYGQDGEYLGKLSANKFDPESISNPVGEYGSPCSPKSVNNPVGRYGSTVSSESANNPLATNAPRIYHGKDK